MNRKALLRYFTLTVILFNILVPFICALTDSEYIESGFNDRVVTCYRDGTYINDWITAIVARNDKDSFCGFLFKDFNVSETSLINNATLVFYYYNNIDYGTNDTTILVEGIHGSPSSLNWDTVVNGIDTASFTTYNVSQFNAGEGFYSIDVTTIIQELILSPGYTQGDNFILRTFHLAPSGPGSDPTFYNYGVGSNLITPGSRRPELILDYTPDVYYEGWTITTTPGLSDSMFMVEKNPGGPELYRYDPLTSSWNNYTLPGQGLITHATGSVQGIVIGNDVYVLTENVTETEVNLYNSTLSDLSTWRYMATVCTNQPRDYVIGFIPGENLIISLTLEVNTGTLKQHTYNRTDGSTSGSTLHSGFGSTANSGVDCVFDNVTGILHIAFSTAQVGNSNQKTRYVNYTQGIGWGSVITPGITQTYSPVIELFNGSRVFILHRYSGDQGLYEMHADPPYNSFHAQVLARANNGNWMESIIFEDKMFYVFTQTGGTDHKELRRFHVQNHTSDAYPGLGGSWVNYTGSELLDTISIIWNNSETVLSYLEGVDRLYLFPNITYLRNQNPTPLSWWANIYQADLDFGISEQVGSLASIEFYNYTAPSGNVTYTPPPGENSTCVDLYLTLNYPGGYNATNVQEAIDYCETWTPPTPPGENPYPGDWSTTKKAYKRLFLLLGIALIAVPWILWAITRDFSLIGVILVGNALGIALLIEFMTL